MTQATNFAGELSGQIVNPDIGRIEQQDCSMLDWTSAANGALLLMPGAP
jgi:hypothetical protein